MMSDPAIRKVKAAIEEAKRKGGMTEVTINADDAERLCIFSEGLIRTRAESGMHERQKWIAEEKLAKAESMAANYLELLDFLDREIGDPQYAGSPRQKQVRAALAGEMTKARDPRMQAMAIEIAAINMNDYAQRLRQQADELENNQ